MAHTISKRLLTVLLISISLFEQTLYARPKIVAVENNSDRAAEVAGYTGSNAIPNGTKKRFRFPVQIPFVSIAKYRDAFIAGEPYFPQEGLIIKTSRGRYALWRDETGIMYALEHRPGLARSECFPMPFFRQGGTEMSERIIQSLILLLTINNQGELDLTQHKA
jgi:hypothetical protein